MHRLLHLGVTNLYHGPNTIFCLARTKIHPSRLGAGSKSGTFGQLGKLEHYQQGRKVGHLRPSRVIDYSCSGLTNSLPP